ncbi:MAG: ABC transporter permease [Roseitalea sp.]|jgi:peptide/nickel transport system permease protein|nr:ABC transporter permease [Roseitalea sp.]MBO6745301.1 ABC transporter permease [Roseitalea sp.]
MFHRLAIRTAQSTLALAGLLLLVFFLSRLTGNPTDLYLPMSASLEAREAFAEKHGFNDPVLQQFLDYVRGILQFDLGDSIFQGRPAIDAVLEAFPVTLRLAAVTMALSFTIAVVVGSVAAMRPNGPFDRLASVLTLTSASAPDFWIAIVGILVFSVGFGLLPTSGMGGPLYWVLPVLVLSVRPIGLMTQVVRATMISALASSYAKTARAKGVPERRVVFGHALPNSMLPVVTVAADLTAGFINGAVVVETIFGWPGIGNLMLSAIVQRDFAVVQACILVTALAIFVMNVLVDLSYGWFDPRIRETST